MNTSNTFTCEKCNKNNTFSDYLSLEKHKWEFHPIGDIEVYWSDLKKSGKLYSGRYTLAFQDNPYY